MLCFIVWSRDTKLSHMVYPAQVCLEMLNFANYSGDADSKIIRETWARLLDQALSRGGVAEACSVVKRVGSNLCPGDGACFPLETICLHLEKAALVIFFSVLVLIINFCSTFCVLMFASLLKYSLKLY